MRYCPFCGHPLTRDGRCWNCGYWIKTGPIEPFIEDDDED